MRIVIVKAWSRFVCVDQTQRFGRALPYSSLISELVVPAAGPSGSKVTMIESRWNRAEENLNCMVVAEARGPARQFRVDLITLYYLFVDSLPRCSETAINPFSDLFPQFYAQ